jgi:hypothetical protein
VAVSLLEGVRNSSTVGGNARVEATSVVFTARGARAGVAQAGQTNASAATSIVPRISVIFLLMCCSLYLVFG